MAERDPRPALLPLEARGLVFRKNGKALIDGIDLTLGGPGITVIMGPNGAGKSLLLRLLHGLLSPTAGEIRWGGRPLSLSVRRRQAMVFQKPVLLRRSVAANVAFALKLVGENTPAHREAWLARVGLADRSRQPARSLSGGEQQRLALARALALKPEVLFLDEPTASLDPAATQRIEQIVADAKADGVKIVFVTHDVGQARRLAEDVVFLHHGQVVEQAPAARFFANPTSTAAQHYLAGHLIL